MTPTHHQEHNERRERIDRAVRHLETQAQGSDRHQTGAQGSPESDEMRSLTDLVGGRVLAWVGGAATLLGIILFLVVAISRGWVGVEPRVALAGMASACLMATGAWLHHRRGRTEASIVLVGAGTAGL